MRSGKEIKRDLERRKGQMNAADALVKEYVDYKEEAGFMPKALRPGYKAARQQARKMRSAVKTLRRKYRRRKNRNKPREKAHRYAVSKLGTTEHPPGSNDGPLIRKWWSWLGYGSPVPWCGCFAGFDVIKKGAADIPSRIRLGYTPYIEQDARNHANGLRAVSEHGCKRGTLVVFHFGSGGAKHVGVATGPVAFGQVTTIDGNTSAGSGGSEDNGGGVFQRSRPVSHVICFAEYDG